MKILVSYGFGAGWSTWNSGKARRYMLTYQPIIEFLEKGGEFTYEDCHGKELGDDAVHPLLIQLKKECLDKFDEHVCVLGAGDLVVVDVSGLFRITEYDGNESVETSYDVGWDVAE